MIIQIIFKTKYLELVTLGNWDCSAISVANFSQDVVYILFSLFLIYGGLGVGVGLLSHFFGLGLLVVGV